MLFLYAMTVLMLEEEKAVIIERNTVDARGCLTLWIVAGNWFTIVQPLISEEVPAVIRLTARLVADEDQRRAGGARSHER